MKLGRLLSEYICRHTNGELLRYRLSSKRSVKCSVFRAVSFHSLFLPLLCFLSLWWGRLEVLKHSQSELYLGTLGKSGHGQLNTVPQVLGQGLMELHLLPLTATHPATVKRWLLSLALFNAFHTSGRPNDCASASLERSPRDLIRSFLVFTASFPSPLRLSRTPLPTVCDYSNLDHLPMTSYPPNANDFISTL